MASAAEQLAANLNFSAFSKAEELKKRIWFTLGALIVYRLGTYIPLPGINLEALQEAFQQQSQGILGMFNRFAGGAVGRMAIFALGIMPYISASIIVQLMTAVVPRLEQLKKEGEQGRKVINQYTRYLTVVLAVFQSYGIAAGLLRRSRDGVRVLGGGELTAKLSFDVAGAAGPARAAIEKAGGSIKVVEERVPEVGKYGKKAPR
jgi:preprotein translocase subunit SecY